jgi:3-oxo-5,6-didehydrosuberyl-CoA/3-oxoadipyl-CoA thiolase
MQQRFGTDSMPETAENVAELLNISRADQDAFAFRSQQRTAQAQRDGILAQEIVPVNDCRQERGGKRRARGRASAGGHHP